MSYNLDYSSHFINIAFNIALNNVGLTYPNPSVGAVIVKDDVIVSKAVTQSSGGSHAEFMAIQNAGCDVSGADLFVTLEPCCHYGKNPPCTDIIIKSKIKRVFYLYQDSNPVVNGKGVEVLVNAGIDCIKLNPNCIVKLPFGGLRYNYSNIFVSLKAASSLDLKVALESGESKWITNSGSRRYVQYLRRVNEILITGIGTIISDDPSLNCRIDQRSDSHLAILDSNLRVSTSLKVFSENLHKKIFVFFDAKNDLAKKKAEFAENVNVEFVAIDKDSFGLNISQILSFLYSKNYKSALVEAGPRLISSFIIQSKFDLLYLFSSNLILGQEAINLFQIDSPERLINSSNLSLIDVKKYGQDILRVLAPIRPNQI